jgi:thiosulfate/3-mercaptopyruvate sulfurtransferase
MTDGGRVISAAALRERLEDPSVSILEVSAATDEEGYRRGHIPGAQWAHWKTLLWDERMRAFPDPRETARRLEELGVGRESALVLYGDPVQYGTYALWALTASGQRDLLVLDGGKEHWVGAGHELSTAAEHSRPGGPRRAGPPDLSAVVGRADVLAAIDRPGQIIVDFRSPGMAGGVDHGAERAGHIPSARHLDYRELLNDDHTFTTPAELAAALAARGIERDEQIIGYCRLSHRATLGWVALGDVAGLSSVRVYDGSWTEWGSMVGVPIEA